MVFNGILLIFVKVNRRRILRNWWPMLLEWVILYVSVSAPCLAESLGWPCCSPSWQILNPQTGPGNRILGDVAVRRRRGLLFSYFGSWEGRFEGPHLVDNSPLGVSVPKNKSKGYIWKVDIQSLDSQRYFCHPGNLWASVVCPSRNIGKPELQFILRFTGSK